MRKIKLRMMLVTYLKGGKETEIFNLLIQEKFQKDFMNYYQGLIVLQNAEKI